MLDIRSSYLETMPDGSPRGLRVILGNDEGAIYPVLLPADYHEKSTADVLTTALELMYQREFPGRAETEKFEHMDRAIADARATTLANENMLRSISFAMTTLMATLEEQGVITLDGVAADDTTDDN